MKTKKLIQNLVSLAVGALVLSGCGNGDSSDSSDPSNAASSSYPYAKNLIIGHDTNNNLLGFLWQRTGKAVGSDGKTYFFAKTSVTNGDRSVSTFSNAIPVTTDDPVRIECRKDDTYNSDPDIGTEYVYNCTTVSDQSSGIYFAYTFDLHLYKNGTTIFYESADNRLGNSDDIKLNALIPDGSGFFKPAVISELN